MKSSVEKRRVEYGTVEAVVACLEEHRKEQKSTVYCTVVSRMACKAKNGTGSSGTPSTAQVTSVVQRKAP